MKSRKEESGKILRTILSVLCFTSQISITPSFAADLIGGGSQSPQPSCVAGKCGTTTQESKDSATSNQFMEGKTLSAATQQRTFEVRQGQSIQAAINQAASGDIVRVYGGANGTAAVYNERLTLKEGITLEASGNVEVNLEDNIATNGDALVMKNNVTVRGFTFRFGNKVEKNFVVTFDYSVRNAVLENNTILGIVKLDGSENTVLGNVIRSGGGTALAIGGGANKILKNILVAETFFNTTKAETDQGVVTITYAAGATRIPGKNVLDGNTIYGFGEGKFSIGGGAVYSVGIRIVNGPLNVIGIDHIITNTIIANTGRRSIEGFSGASTSMLSYSILDKPTTFTKIGTGVIIGANSGLVNPAGGDFRIFSDSIARDAGDPNSPKDADGTRADIGAKSYSANPIVIDEVFLVTKGESAPTIDAFMTLLAKKGITSISRAEVEALQASVTLVGNQKFSVSSYIITTSGSEVFIAVAGSRDTYSCTTVSGGIQTCRIVSMTPLAAGLYKARSSSKGVRIELSGLDASRIGFTQEGDLWLQPIYASTAIYDNSGGIKAYPRNAYLIRQVSPDGKYTVTYKEVVSGGQNFQYLAVAGPNGVNFEIKVGNSAFRLLNEETFSVTNEGVFYAAKAPNTNPEIRYFSFVERSVKTVPLPPVISPIQSAHFLSSGVARIFYQNGHSVAINVNDIMNPFVSALATKISPDGKYVVSYRTAFVNGQNMQYLVVKGPGGLFFEMQVGNSSFRLTEAGFTVTNDGVYFAASEAGKTPEIRYFSFTGPRYVERLILPTPPTSQKLIRVFFFTNGSVNLFFADAISQLNSLAYLNRVKV